jgi:D-3-phosphoglycerate dehydrogenase
MSTGPWQIVFAEHYDEWAIERMRSAGNVTILDSCDEETLCNAVPGFDALLVRSTACVSEAVLDRADRLRVVGRGGVGLENIDIEAARRRGIAVVYTPAAATESVADLAVGLMIGILRRIRWADAAVREGTFMEARRNARSVDLLELTLGIVGLGRIGRAVARRCHRGFGMTVVYNDIVAPGPLDFTATPLEKDELYAQADIVSLHVTLTELTRHLIDEQTLSRFKPGALLVNTSRGAVVDSDALARALAAGSLGGAALDVFEPEPLPLDHPLQYAPNTLFTPHLAARTHGGLHRMNAVVEDVLGVLSGKPPRYPAWS